MHQGFLFFAHINPYFYTMERVFAYLKQGVTSNWVMLIILSFVWGSSFILMKRGLEVFTAPQVGAIRILSAGMFLLPVGYQAFRRINRRNVLPLFFSGFLGSLLPACLFALAETQLSSAVTGIMNALTPIFVLMIGTLFFNLKDFTKRIVFGLCVAFGGTVILLLADAGGSFFNLNFYAIFVLIATVCYGVNANLVKHFLGGLKPLEITSVSLGMMVPFVGVYLFQVSDFSQRLLLEDQAYAALGYLLILGFIGTSLALIAFNRLVQQAGPVFASLVTYLIPVFALFWGVMDGEEILTGHYMGMMTIVLGVAITNEKI